HGGKAVIDGPQNYLGNLHRAVPVGITVEGANILTRNLIVFGQGAIRAHPYLLDEMNALADTDRERGLTAFDKAFWKHVGHSLETLLRAFGRSWTFGAFALAPDAGEATPFYRQLSRYSAAFALCADMALLTLDLAHVDDDGGFARLERAFALVVSSDAIAKRMRAAHMTDWKDAVAKGVITQAEGEQLAAVHEAVAKVIEVDDFAPEALSPI